MFKEENKNACKQIKITHLFLPFKHSAYGPVAELSPNSYGPG